MSQPLFGLVPAGQPVITTPNESPTPTTFFFAIPPSPTPKPSSHIVVFLLPGVILPEGTAAAIYLVTPPGPNQVTPNSKFLGGIGPGKESAIFKLGTSAGQNLVLGISVEQAESVAARMGELGASASSPGTLAALVPAGVGGYGGQSQSSPLALVLAQRIIKNAFNFLSSFSGTAGLNQVEVVPLKAFEEWWRKFESRVRTDPGFLERDN
ncbi:hypothetical protein B0T25DRAFT_214430 [Lasiosphaeria hispida]|uniref:Hikeshi-like domain-containing protein n=1 Tax=Lasiosphaeria hispida TaxID=260671 RepID=A0AAJ0HIV4_9PEZI|nr:hypothetical protein B0T25DRAFT_214430 [Lasiosphaeria hispida]